MARARLLRWFHAGVAAVDARQRVRAALASQPMPPRWHLLAVGKAATAMAAGALAAWPKGCAGGVVVAPAGSQLPPPGVGGSAVGPVGDGAGPLPPGIATFEGAHPVPDERSLAAGAALLDYAARLASPEFRDDPVLLLVSGGASALAEALRPGVTLNDLQALTRAALADGADIVELNTRRRAVSRLKGGALVHALGAHRVQALLVSDVPADDPCVIGSGLACGKTPDTRPAQLQVVASLEDALESMVAAAAVEGCRLERLPGRFSGEAVGVAQRFLGACRNRAAGTGLLWGGESTVVLPATPGRGGRNQHLALAAALALAGTGGPAYPEGLVLLAAGTDGVDGNSDDAGAVVDAGTVMRGEIGAGSSAMAALSALAAADSGRFLEAAGDLVHTGSTDTNVGDILVAWWPCAPRQGSS